MDDLELQTLANEAAAQSVQHVPDSDALAMPFLAREAVASQIAPPWWSPARDAFLREFWRTSDHLSTVMYTAQSILTGIPIRIVAKDPTITAHVDEALWLNEVLFHVSEFGSTLTTAMSKFVIDYLSTDNGGFLEIIGDGNKGGPIVGQPLAVAHLDSQFAWRTGNQEYPVIYWDPLTGQAYKMHSSRVLFMSQMPSPERRMLGVGVCAVSRSLQVSQNLYDIYTYKQEKLGSRPVNTMLVGRGYSAQTIMEAVKMANAVMDQRGLTRYSKVIAMGNANPASGIDTLDLNRFDPFDEEKGVNLAMFILAGAFGLPISEVWAYMGAGQTRSVDNQISRQRGKLPTEFSEVFGATLGIKFLPEYLKIVSDYTDDTQDERRAVINDIRARNRQRDAQTGVTSIRSMREQMLVDGEFTREQFVRIELADGRLENGAPVQSLFYSRDPFYVDILALGVGAPTVSAMHDPRSMIVKLELAMARAYSMFPIINGINDTLKLHSAVAAIDSLLRVYKGAIAPVPPEGDAARDSGAPPVSSDRGTDQSNPGTVEQFG